MRFGSLAVDDDVAGGRPRSGSRFGIPSAATGPHRRKRWPIATAIVVGVVVLSGGAVFAAAQLPGRQPAAAAAAGSPSGAADPNDLNRPADKSVLVSQADLRGSGWSATTASGGTGPAADPMQTCLTGTDQVADQVGDAVTSPTFTSDPMSVTASARAFHAAGASSFSGAVATTFDRCFTDHAQQEMTAQLSAEGLQIHRVDFSKTQTDVDGVTVTTYTAGVVVDADTGAVAATAFAATVQGTHTVTLVTGRESAAQGRRLGSDVWYTTGRLANKIVRFEGQQGS